MMLIHGVGGSRHSWDPVGLDGAVDLPALAGPAELAAALEVRSPTIVIGHSLGGMVTQELALEPGTRVRAMVLCSTIPGATPRVRELNDASAAYVEAHGSRAHATRMAPYLFGPDASPELRERYVEETAGVDPLLMAAQLRAIGRWDARERLASCRVPALVVAGEHEGNLDDQQKLAALLDAELVVIAGTGHMVPMERPESFLAAITPFLAQHADPRPDA